MKSSIPEAILREYQEQQKKQFKGRTRLFIAVAGAIYFLVSFFYFGRFLLGNAEAFRWRELYEWAAMLAGSAWLYFANEQSNNPDLSKRYSYLFDIFLVAMVSRLGFLYPHSAMVFSFYFTLSLIIVGFTIPWTVPEISTICAGHLLAYSGFYYHLTRNMHYFPPAVPRFHPYFDGMLYMAVCSGICILLCKKRIDLDLKNFTLLKEIEEKNNQIQKDLEFANLVHRTLVPASISTDKVEITVTYLPKAYVGGDYAKFYFPDQDRLVIFICDVTGHGVAAALMVNRIHAEFERLAKEGLLPGELLRRLNEFIYVDFNGTGLYLSAFGGILDFKSRKFSFSNYGHPPQYLHQTAEGQIRKLGAQTSLLGVSQDNLIYEEQTTFDTGDRIVLFTDGIIEAKNAAGEEYGSARLKDFLLRYPKGKVTGFNEALLGDLKHHHGAKPHDDVFLLTIQVR